MKKTPEHSPLILFYLKNSEKLNLQEALVLNFFQRLIVKYGNIF